jgi:hypothetical protein
MFYVIFNELDEKIRLVRADTPDQAIIKAKASITPEELIDIGERIVQAWRKIKESWEITVNQAEKHRKWCLENDIAPPPPLVNQFSDPESYRKIDLDEYNWQVLQEIDLNFDLVVLEDLCL